MVTVAKEEEADRCCYYMCLEKDSFVGGHNSSFIAYKVIFFSQAFALAKEGNHQEKCTKAFHVHIIDLKSFLEGTYVYSGRAVALLLQVQVQASKVKERALLCEAITAEDREEKGKYRFL